MKRQGVDLTACKVFVGYRHKYHKYEEARECFRLFDKRDKGMVTTGDLKASLPNYLDFPVTQQDIEDFVNECGGQEDGTGSGSIDVNKFTDMYLGK